MYVICKLNKNYYLSKEEKFMLIVLKKKIILFCITVRFTFDGIQTKIFILVSS